MTTRAFVDIGRDGPKYPSSFPRCTFVPSSRVRAILPTSIAPTCTKATGIVDPSGRGHDSCVTVDRCALPGNE